MDEYIIRGINYNILKIDGGCLGSSYQNVPTSDPILDSLENLQTKIQNLHEHMSKLASPMNGRSGNATLEQYDQCIH